MYACCTYLHVEFIFELRPLEALVQQPLSDFSALLLIQRVADLPHVFLDPGEHLHSAAGVVIVQLQKRGGDGVLLMEDKYFSC